MNRAKFGWKRLALEVLAMFGCLGFTLLLIYLEGGWR
jgi:hypothetical protein